MSDKEFEQLAPWNEEVKAEIKRRAANLKKQVLGDYKKIPTTRRQSARQKQQERRVSRWKR